MWAYIYVHCEVGYALGIHVCMNMCMCVLSVVCAVCVIRCVCCVCVLCVLSVVCVVCVLSVVCASSALCVVLYLLCAHVLVAHCCVVSTVCLVCRTGHVLPHKQTRCTQVWCMQCKAYSGVVYACKAYSGVV